MNHYLELLNKSAWAGILIGIAGMGYLANSSVGPFLFAFGLTAVILYEAKLFTGVSGFVKNKQDLIDLPFIIIGNIFGCWFMGLITQFNHIDIIYSAMAILEKRLNSGPIANGVMAIGCGILMTASVNFAKKGHELKHWLPLLLGVPLFIVSGFPHCIADAFYYLSCPYDLLYEYKWIILSNYIFIVIGNFIGCNLYRLFNN